MCFPFICRYWFKYQLFLLSRTMLSVKVLPFPSGISVSNQRQIKEEKERSCKVSPLPFHLLYVPSHSLNPHLPYSPSEVSESQSSPLILLSPRPSSPILPSPLPSPLPHTSVIGLHHIAAIFVIFYASLYYSLGFTFLLFYLFFP